MMDSQLQTPAIKQWERTNYKEWAFDVSFVLRQKICWRITTGTEMEPDGPTSETSPATEASPEWLLWTESGYCDVHIYPDDGAPYATGVHGLVR